MYQGWSALTRANRLVCAFLARWQTSTLGASHFGKRTKSRLHLRHQQNVSVRTPRAIGTERANDINKTVTAQHLTSYIAYDGFLAWPDRNVSWRCTLPRPIPRCRQDPNHPIRRLTLGTPWATLKKRSHHKCPNPRVGYLARIGLPLWQLPWPIPLTTRCLNHRVPAAFMTITTFIYSSLGCLGSPKELEIGLHLRHLCFLFYIVYYGKTGIPFLILYVFLAVTSAYEIDYNQGQSPTLLYLTVSTTCRVNMPTLVTKFLSYESRHDLSRHLASRGQGVYNGRRTAYGESRERNVTSVTREP